MAKTKVTSTVEISGELLVYIGPNITKSVNGMLFAFQTFETLPAYAEADRNLKALFVPASGMAAARKELAVQGSRLFNAAKAVREQILAAGKEE